MENKIKELFARFSKKYHKHMVETNHVKVQQQILENFLQYIKGKVLDIATGTGFVAKYVKQKTNSDVYAIDFCLDMITEAQRNSIGVNFRIGDVHNLPYQDNSFNVVLCSYGFYWFEDRTKVISEINRVLKTEGLFILLEEEFKEGFEPRPRFSEKGDYLSQLASLENYVGTIKLKEEIKKSGFQIIKMVRFPIDSMHDTMGMVYKKATPS